jgi:glycosyltransferase involved in cell wall biosynthesis
MKTFGMHAGLRDRLPSRPKILMSAYYCSPYKGSDWRVGWGRAIGAAQQFNVVVITSELSRGDISRYESEHGPLRNPRFVFVAEDRSSFLRKIQIPYLYIDPFSYGTWQHRAYKVAKELHRAYAFDLIHQVNLIGFREPGELWRLNAPFVWGPIGGTQYFPWRFLGSARLKDAIFESCRSLGNAVQLHLSRKVHRVLKRADAVLVANSDAYRAFRPYRADCIQLLETGLDRVSEIRPGTAPGEPLRILWSGEVHFRKALHLLLRALPKVAQAIPFELHVLGRGEGLSRAQALAERLGIANSCRFLGWLPLKAAMEQSRWADVFVFTSLRDTSGNVMLEAMSCGVPVIAFDHQGAGDIVTEDSGIKLPVTSPRDAVERIAQAIIFLGSNRNHLATLSDGALARAEEFLWERNAEKVSNLYWNILGKPQQARDTERELNVAV